MSRFTVGTTVGTTVGRTFTTRGAVPFPRPAVPAHQPGCCCPACLGLQCLERPHYFAGQLLTEAELNSEQAYILAKNRLHNRYLVGWGVVCGMEVVCNDCEGFVTVRAGYAIDPCGNDIIVCKDQPFDVINAIKACCDTSRTRPDCGPLRSDIPDTCKDVEQQWCLSIAYQEKEARPTTALRQQQHKKCRCGCSNCGQASGCGCGCGCGCGSGSKTTAMGAAVNGCASRVQNGISNTTPACEPTRIVEGYQLCLAPATSETPGQSGPEPGTLIYELFTCVEEWITLLLQAPVGLDTMQDVNAARQACCQYLNTVKRSLLNASIETCDILDELSAIQCPDSPPGFDQTVKQLVRLLSLQLHECACLALLPKCPGDVCDDRVPLATITIRNNKVVRICNLACRKQLITLPALCYWLSFLFSPIIDAIVALFRNICCGTADTRDSLNANATYVKQNLTTMGFSNPAMVNRAFASHLAQVLGPSATAALARANGTTVIDTRPFVGQGVETVQSALKQQGVQQVSLSRVDSDPAWSDDAVARAAQFAPAAVSPNQPLTLFTKGTIVVGIDVPDDVEILKQQVATLQQQVQQLTGQAGGGPGTGDSSSPGSGTLNHA